MDLVDYKQKMEQLITRHYGFMIADETLPVIHHYAQNLLFSRLQKIIDYSHAYGPKTRRSALEQTVEEIIAFAPRTENDETLRGFFENVQKYALHDKPPDNEKPAYEKPVAEAIASFMIAHVKSRNPVGHYQYHHQRMYCHEAILKQH